MKWLWWLALPVVLPLMVTAALAHGWYDPWCCDSRDCRPIDRERVRVTDEGYLVAGARLFPFSEVRMSQDGEFHLCESGGHARCLYVPVAGS